MDPEHQRLVEHSQQTANWKLWGPYLAERAWGTVREDYSPDGIGWSALPHDHARSRAYRWNEDGLAGISDRGQYLCLALALWNGNDPILKERLFGLDHGEDVKEAYFYLDNTPTHSFMRMRYLYPHAYPYAELVEENGRRTRSDPEFEIYDTNAFDDGRYFDVEVIYAKAAMADLLMQVRVVNRGPDTAECVVAPSLWFRNTWSWGYDAGPMEDVRARPRLAEEQGAVAVVIASHLAWLLVCHRIWCVRRDDANWWTAALNYVGSIFFMLSAIAAFTLPTTGEELNTALVNSATFAGAVCFFVGAYLLLPPVVSRVKP